jgi:SAM-dependent methyltransferase
VELSDAVVWHDVECGAYAADLPLWRELAAAAGGPVLDLGAGTGRVTLDLARRGHEVHALDVDPALLAALRERAGALPVVTHAADAREFAIGRRFALAVAPMQTVQLLGGAEARASFLRCVHRHLEPGALLAAALANVLEGYDADTDDDVAPDMREVDGVVYASRPTAVRDHGGAFVLERARERVARDGERTVQRDVIRLDRVTGAALAEEARAAGFTPEPSRFVAPTDDHVGSEVAILRA